MKSRTKSCFMLKVSLGLTATVLFIQNNPAVAQESDEVLEEIVVETPAVVIRDEWTAMEKLKVLELRRSVDYSDLDLALHKDVVEFEARIEAAAQEVCRELADQKPRLRNPESTCIRNAVDGAIEEMDMIVAAANE